jgi:pterin-4a-carbinolamine dehydratase
MGTFSKRWSGQATDDHPHRCISRARRTGERCKRFALVGAKKCHKHGGRRELDGGSLVRIDHLPRFYRDKLSKTLAEAVEQQTACAPHEQLALFEELAVLRVMAGDAMQLWSVAKELVARENTSANQLILVEAEKCVREAFAEVQRTAEGGARIMSMCKDKLTPHNLQATVNQLVRIMHEKAKGNPTLELFAEDYERAVAATVRVVDIARGTDHTPDMIVAEMDDTIPGHEGDVDAEEED